jgi:hypothetical protein
MRRQSVFGSMFTVASTQRYSIYSVYGTYSNGLYRYVDVMLIILPISSFQTSLST